MLSVNDALYGWSPIGGDDEDVSISPDAHFLTIKPFPATSDTFLSPICPPLDTAPGACPPRPQSTSSAPLTRVTHSSMAPSSDRRAQRNRNRDPSWIPRPRNAFIIFRCEYSREHSQGAQDSQSDDDSTNATVKTLSKRAADAWKQLPASERERYKVLADKEREEHARLYPHYRFRPMKRQLSGPRKPSRERSQGPRMPSVEHPPVPSTHLPSVLAPAPDKPRSSPPTERAEVTAPVPRTTAMPLPEPSSYPMNARAEPQAPLSVDYNDALLFCSLSEATLRSDSSPHSAPVELYAPLCTSAGSIPPDAFRCHDSAPGVDLSLDDAERAQALEAYAIGLYNYDLFSSFSFPEYY